MCRHPDEYDRAGQRVGPVYEIQKGSAFKKAMSATNLLYKNVPGEKKPKKLNFAKIWLDSRDAAEYSKRMFCPPDKQPQGTFNLYRGPGISREQAETAYPNLKDALDTCKPVRDHLLHIWNRGSHRDLDYTEKYFATLVQDPFNKMGTALVIVGERGSGKDVIMEFVRACVGSSFKEIHHTKSVLGAFNGILEDALVCYFNEVDFTGDKKAATGELQALITQEKQVINKKFIPRGVFDSYMNVVICTNNVHAVPVKAKARRYVCRETDSKWAGPDTPEKTAYFKSIRAVPKEAVARWWYSIDTSDFNPRSGVLNDCLVAQMKMSMQPVEQYLHESFTEGQICGRELSEEDTIDVSKDDVWQAYTDQNNSGKVHFWRAVNLIMGDVVKDARPGGKYTKIFPAIQECKAQFDKYFGMTAGFSMFD